MAHREDFVMRLLIHRESFSRFLLEKTAAYRLFTEGDAVLCRSIHLLRVSSRNRRRSRNEREREAMLVFRSFLLRFTQCARTRYSF